MAERLMIKEFRKFTVIIKETEDGNLIIETKLKEEK